MIPNAWMPLALLFSSLVTSLVIFTLDDRLVRTRVAINMAGATLKVVLVVLTLNGVYHEQVYELRFALVPGLDFILRVDALALLFLTLSAGLWFVTTIYAISYFAGTPHLNRFFGFFSLCVAATTGIALAGNPITFFLFYEMLTLSTYPLVVHKGDGASLAAGRKYLAYTLGGSAALLIGIVWLESVTGPIEFSLRDRTFIADDLNRPELQVIFALLIGGLGVKAALVPLHGWLPVAMAAPAPVSALLHAVAVVKAGAFGIVRVIFDVYGFDLVDELGVGPPLAFVASITILYGSARALSQSDIKRRLAYSTVSQISYITLGAALLGPAAATGGLVHLVHQGLMKITLFFGAGALAETLHIHRVEELDGVGRRMPWTMLAFSIAALGMIGVPPVAGFASKWYLGVGGLQVEQTWVIFVLAGSSLLNAAYFLPLLYRIWFKLPAGPWREGERKWRYETALGLFLPPVATALVALAAGVFAASGISPLGWARLIVQRDYGL